MNYEAGENLYWPSWFRRGAFKSVEVEGAAYLKINGLWSIVTLEGPMEISKGDYVIQGVKGEIYPCKPEIFEASYDKVDDVEV